MVKGILANPWSQFFYWVENNRCRHDSCKLIKIQCHLWHLRLNFFSQRGVHRWNSLSQEDTDVAFWTDCLEKRRHRQMDFIKDGYSASPHDYWMTGCSRERQVKNCARCSAGNTSYGVMDGNSAAHTVLRIKTASLVPRRKSLMNI